MQRKRLVLIALLTLVGAPLVVSLAAAVVYALADHFRYSPLQRELLAAAEPGDEDSAEAKRVLMRRLPPGIPAPRALETLAAQSFRCKTIDGGNTECTAARDDLAVTRAWTIRLRFDDAQRLVDVRVATEDVRW